LKFVTMWHKAVDVAALFFQVLCIMGPLVCTTLHCVLWGTHWSKDFTR